MARFVNLFCRSSLGGNGAGAGGVSPPAPEAGGQRKRGLVWTFGVVLLLLAVHIGTSGLYWSWYFHPDEPTVARWINQTKDYGYIKDRLYPSGWFELFRIRFWAEKHLGKLTHAWHTHAIQNGRVIAISASTFSRGDSEEEKTNHDIQDGRNFNAWLYVLTVLFLYVACLEAGFHPVVALVSGLFFLGSAAPIEYIRYCETDAGLLVSMAFFAWLSARALRKRSVLPMLAGAFASGFAVSCKFSLGPLLLWCFVGPVAVRPRGGERWGRWLARISAWVVLALGLAVVGYWVGTPALRMAPEWYMAHLQKASNVTYGEIVQNLGGVYSWRGATVLRVRSFVQSLAAIGWLPLGWGVFSWSFWFVPRFRRQLAGIPCLLPVFVVFWVLGCPFVRSQELLPLALIFGMGAALPLQWWIGRAKEDCLSGWRSWGGAVAMGLFGMVAFCVQACQALGMTSCFQLRDTRAEAQNWLHDSVRSGTPLLFDAYATAAVRGVDCHPSSLHGLSWCWTGRPPLTTEEEVPLYHLENEGFEGRMPLRDAKRTGDFLPEVKENVAAYNAAVFPVRTWGLSRRAPRPTFVQPRIRLVSFETPSSGAFDIPIGHARPILLIPDGLHLHDAAGPAGPGPFRAIRSKGKHSTVHLNLEDGPRWLVSRMFEGGEPVRIVREGLFRPATADLGVGGAVAAALEPSLGDRVRALVAARASMRCRMRGDDQNVVCATYLASSAAEAARELRLAGDGAGALELLRAAEPLDAAGRVEAFMAAADAGIAPDEAWTEAAREAVAAADRLASERGRVGRTEATLCGVPIGILDDFAHARLDNRLLESGGCLPVWLPPGHYEVCLTVRSDRHLRFPMRLFEGQSADFSVTPIAGNEWTMTAPIMVSSGRMLCLSEMAETAPFTPFNADIEIVWDPVEQTLETAEHIREALQKVGVPSAKDGVDCEA